MEWKWITPGNEWLVLTDRKKGIIKVYEKGKVIFERNDLSDEVVNMIEANFMNVVAKQINTKDSIQGPAAQTAAIKRKPPRNEDVMFA